jgi:putative acetyltransferase
MTLRIRTAVAADTERLFDVWQTAVEATHDFVSAADKSEIARMVREDYLPVADLDVVVDAEDVPLAFMGMTDAEIDSLFVHADARGTGAGRQLVELALSRFPIVRTEVNEQNAQGVGFWLHMGFRQIGRSDTDGQGRPYPLLRLERAR